MKKLSSFKDNKVDLKEIQGGGYGNGGPRFSGWVLWDYPGGASTPGNSQSLVHADFTEGSYY